MLVHPAIAESYARALEGAVSRESIDRDLPAAALDGPDLLRRFASVSDERPGRGRDHPVAVVLTLCAAAVLAGMRSFTAIAGWVADVPVELLARLHDLLVITCGATTVFPSKSTLWRVLTDATAATVDAAAGAWPHAHATARDRAGADTGATGQGAGHHAALVAIAVDGTTVRGAIDADGAQAHPLAMPTHRERLVLDQVEAGAKSNEIPQFTPPLGELATTGVNLVDAVITTDALHTQRAHTEYPHSIWHPIDSHALEIRLR
ncbi:MAG: transposase family protein [Pseudonocardiaceae bacterium]